MRRLIAAVLVLLRCLEAVSAGSAPKATPQDRRILSAAAVPSGRLLGRQAYFSEEPGSENGVLVLPNAAVVLPPLAGVAAAHPVGTPEECSALCRQTANCTAFWHCGIEAGCPDGAGGLLARNACALLGSVCGSVPLQARRSPSAVKVTSGFPVGAPLALPASAPLQAAFGQGIQGQVIQGGDMSCDGSLLPTSCALGSVEEAAALCLAAAPACRALVLYSQGLDGCSAALAVLKSSAPGSNNSFVSPNVAVYTRQADPAASEGASTCGTGLSAGAVAGIAVAACIVSAALGGLLVWAGMARRQGRRARSCSSGKAESAHSEYLAAALGEGQGAPPRAPPQALQQAHQPGQPAGHEPHSPIHSPPLSGALSSKATSGEIIPELVQAVAAADVRRFSVDVRRASVDARRFSVDRRRSMECRMAAMARLPPHLREWVVDLRQVEFLTGPSGEPMEIGAGASASVFLARFNGEIVAAKEIDIGMSKLNRDTFIQEAVSLHALRHQNVVAFYGLSIAGRKGVVLCEYCEGRDLYSALEIRGQTARGAWERVFAWRRRGRRVALDVARALNYLHSKGIVHMDLKSPNVLLTVTGTAKICDVGFSRVKQNGVLPTDNMQIGTFAWAAPEVLMGKPCSQSVDIYSMGVLMWELITGERPQRGNMRLPRVPEECSQETCDLMLRCLKEDPEARPSAKELMRALGEDRRRTNQAGSCSMEAPERPAGVAVHAPPPPTAASPFANGSPATTAPTSAMGAPTAAASPFANGSPTATGPPSVTGAPTAAASPFANAAPAAGASHAADGEPGALPAPALPFARLPAVPEVSETVNDASAALLATPYTSGLAAADDSPFVFANGVPGVLGAAGQPPPALPSPRPLLTDQSHIALGSAFNHATPFPSVSS